MVLTALDAAADAVDADALAAALVDAAEAFTAVLPVAAEALKALLTAGVLTLAAELNRALATAPSRIWALAGLTIPKEAITMVAMIIRFIIKDFESISAKPGICYPRRHPFF